ncbi:MAG: serine/threonine-protein kinase [Gemmatales bacterium]
MPVTPNTSVTLPFPQSALFGESGPADTIANASIWHTPPPLPAIPGYELKEELGRGGMGIVYRARDPELKRLVAIKMLLDPEFASAEQRLRFKIEAEAVAQLKHPNIVQVYELGEVVGLAGTTHPFMVLEFVDGPNLFRYMRQHQFTQNEAASLMIILARAIQHAHDHGLIHRDLKPANILLHQEASTDSSTQERTRLLPFTPKITDFGLVKALVFEGEGRRDLTRPELMVGTPQYMAPEQANPSPQAMSSSVDIYSLGVIFYELLTGRLPYDDKDILKMLMEVQTIEPPSPRKLQPRVSADLDTICLKCLSKKPEDRYRSAAALADDLTRFLNHEPIHARPLSEWQRVAKWMRRHPMVATLVGLLFSVVSIALVVIGYLWYEAERKREEAERNARNTEIARDVARTSEKAARDAETLAKQAEKDARDSEKATWGNLYFSKIAQADLLLRQGQIVRSNMLLNTIRKSDQLKDSRCWEWYYLRQICNPMQHVLTDTQDYVQQLQFHPSGESFFAAEGAEFFGDQKEEDFRGRLLQFRYVSSADKWVSRVVYVAPVPIRRMSLMDHGNRAVVLDFKGNLVLVDTQRVGETQTIENVPIIAQLKQWQAASQSTLVLLAQPGSNTLELYDIREERIARSITLPEAVVRFCISANGKRIGYALKDGTLGCWDVDAGKTLWTQAMKGEWQQPVLDDAGVTLAVWTSTGLWQWLDANTGKVLKQGTPWGIKSLELSSRGDRLAVLLAQYAGEDVYVYRRDAAGAIDEMPLVLRGHRGRIYGYSFHPNGQLMLSYGADGTTRVWDTSDIPGKAGQLLNSCIGHQGTVLSAAFDPQGQQLISGGMDANVMVWKTRATIEKDQIQARFNCGGEWISAYRFLDGSSKLAVFEHQNSTLRIIDMKTREQLAMHTLVGVTKLFRAPRYDAVFSPSGEQLAVTNSVGDKAMVFATRTGKLLWETPSFGGRILHTHFSGDGQRLLIAGHFPQPGATNRSIPFKAGFQVYDTTSQQLLCNATVPAYYFGWALNHDGSAVASTQRRADNKFYLGVNLVNQQGKELFAVPIAMNRAFSLAFSPDGKWITCSNFDPFNNNIGLWNASNGEKQWQQFNSLESTHVTFSKDSRRIFSTNYNSDVVLFDTLTGNEVLTLKQHGTPRENDYALSPKVVLSEDETVMAVHGWDAGISLWHAFPRDAYNRDPKRFEKFSK